MKMTSKINYGPFIKKLAASQKRIAAERDKLRDLISDAEELEGHCSEAYDEIQCAIDALSRLQ